VDPHARLRVTSPTMHVRVMRPIYHSGGVVRPPQVVELPSRRALDLVRRSIVVPQPAYTP